MSGMCVVTFSITPHSWGGKISALARPGECPRPGGANSSQFPNGYAIFTHLAVVAVPVALQNQRFGARTANTDDSGTVD